MVISTEQLVPLHQANLKPKVNRTWAQKKNAHRPGLLQLLALRWL